MANKVDVSKYISNGVLEFSDFTQTANIANNESVILEYRVPQGKVLILPLGGIFDLRIVTHESFTLTASTGRTSYTAQLSGDIVDQPSYPMDGGDAVAYWNGTRTTITAIDYTANTVTCTVDANAGTLDIYYIFGDGYLRAYAEPPLGYTVAKRLLFNEGMKMLNTRDHLDTSMVPRYPKTFYLPEKYLFRIYLNSPRVVSWDANAINAVARFNCLFLDMSINPNPSVWSKLASR